jgi:MFS transporter, DHA1 family, multidrug resistance protein
MTALPSSGVSAFPSGTKQRGIAVLVANTGLMSAGFFMLIPLLSVHLTQDLAFSGAAAGAVLAVRQLSQQGLMLFGGALADRVGYRRIIAIGMFVRALGFFGFALGDSLPVILASAVVAGLGGALFEATSKAALASLAAPDERPRLFSLSAIVGSVGTAVGPLIGVALLPLSFALVGIASGAFFMVAFAVSALLLPSLSSAGEGVAAPSFGATLRAIAGHRAFLVFTALLTGFWFLHNQLYIAVPFRAVQVTGGAEVVGLLYAVNAFAGMAFQFPLVRLSNRYLSPAAGVGVGVAVMGIGLGLMLFTAASVSTGSTGSAASIFPSAGLLGISGLTPATVVMVLSMAVFAAGRSLADPLKDVVVSQLAPAGSLGAFFGVAFLALAVGGSLGNYAGGWLHDLSASTGLLALPWLIFIATGLTLGAGLIAFSRRAGPLSPHPVAG